MIQPASSHSDIEYTVTAALKHVMATQQSVQTLSGACLIKKGAGTYLQSSFGSRSVEQQPLNQRFQEPLLQRLKNFGTARRCSLSPPVTMDSNK